MGSYPIVFQHNRQSRDTTVYFVREVQHIYLSLATCKALKLIHKDFPNICINSIVNHTSSDISFQPIEVPHAPTEDNVEKLEAWLLDHFTDTVFNTNSEQLPIMSGKPQLVDDAIPHASHSPIPIPYHWKKEVKEQIDKDVEMGILRPVPVGETTNWCMQMVTVAKKDGGPRRTIDFQPINKHCKRETHHTPRPFDVVSSIPPRTFKTTLDASNGYHQVPLDSGSVKLTTFITEFGRYQYLRTPQGHIASGDAYTRRFNDIITDFPRKNKIIDDVELHDNTITDAFYHVYDFLELCRKNHP